MSKSREIKFRAWDKRYAIMRDFSSHKEGLLYAYGSFEMSSGYDSYDDPTFEENVMEHIEIMQFTGLKDKNGVDIYEGDVLFWDGSIIGAVSFQFAEFICGEGVNARNLCNSPHDEIKVIGNIHANPELLEDDS